MSSLSDEIFLLDQVASSVMRIRSTAVDEIRLALGMCSHPATKRALMSMWQALRTGDVEEINRTVKLTREVCELLRLPLYKNTGAGT